jgi:hypothetical protein
MTSPRSLRRNQPVYCSVNGPIAFACPESDLSRRGKAKYARVSGSRVSAGAPPRQPYVDAIQRDWTNMSCKQDDCTRRAHSRGWCTTHYRRWRAGKPLDDQPIRGYVRYEEGPDGGCQPVADKPKPVRASRGKPFAKELALLEELGLR